MELPPPIDPEDGDYIESALSEPATARFVTRHANTVAWLKWVEEKKFFRRLFDPRATLTDVDAELGGWFAERFQCEHVGESLSVLRRQGQRLSPYFWNLIALRLFRSAPVKPSSEAVLRWLAVLLNHRPQGTNVQHLEYLSTNLMFPEDTVAAVLLFEYLTRPVFRLENNLWSEVKEAGEDVKFELATHGDGFWLNHFWTRFFLPNLADLIDKIEPMVMAHMQQAYWLAHADGTDLAWDVLSSSRSIIEQPDQGRSHDGFGVLVDVGLAVIEWNARHRPSRADALIDLWFTADAFLLKRLAIVGVSLAAHWPADRKLAWLLDKNLLYKRFLKHEVFKVLKGAYPAASAESRKAVLERARQGPPTVPEGGETTAGYETYNLVYWLHESNPECVLAKEAFEALQAAHPDFGKREHPDLDVVSQSGWVGWSSPETAEELLAKTPKEQIDYLLRVREPLRTEPRGFAQRRQ